MCYKTIGCADYKHLGVQLSSLFQRVLWLFIIASMPSLTCAQISFSAVIGLTLKNSPRVKMAEDDAKRSRASLAEMKDAFIPRVAGSSGLGASSGITLSVPTIFTISAQSLLFDYSQLGNIRAGRLGVQAADLSLRGIREQVEEDAIVTYLSLDNAYQCQAALTSQYEYALRLVSIVQERLEAGYENQLELKKARQTALQIKLQKSQMEDRIATLIEHLRGLTGLTNESEFIVPERFPVMDSHPSCSLNWRQCVRIRQIHSPRKRMQRRSLSEPQVNRDTHGCHRWRSRRNTDALAPSITSLPTTT